jgi:predicted NBD/HSP70 family sugar kinase
MENDFRTLRPHIPASLDDAFRPAALADRAFEQDAGGAGEAGERLVIGLEREAGKISRFETRVFPAGHAREAENFFYAERLVKFLLWQRGGFRIYVGGPRRIGEYIRACYAPGAARAFDAAFMGDQVYERPFTVEICSPDAVPDRPETGEVLGRHLRGCRIGFDLGASDRKVSAVVDGKVIYSEEVIWEPRKHSDPTYHYNEIMAALSTAASKMEHLDAIGGSSAGIYIDNRPMVASLFRGIPAERYPEVRDLFARIRQELGVPLVVINDGDVAALAGSMSLEENGVLGIALGSSEAAGYIDMQGHILGWLNEMAFTPIDYNPQAAVDEWSGDLGCGSQYFSQQCVFRLAPKAGIAVPADVTDAEKLKLIQEKLEAGHAGAEAIWQTMGVYMGYGIAHYARFYDMRHVLILGRCTSGRGGNLLLDGACEVLRTEFPELDGRIHVQLPDERNRRVGQSIAAASLPVL